MTGITLEMAQERLMLWLEADAAVSTGQEYRMGTKRLTRADAEQIRKNIEFWEGKVAELDAVSKRKGKRKTVRVVPRDI